MTLKQEVYEALRSDAERFMERVKEVGGEDSTNEAIEAAIDLTAQMTAHLIEGANMLGGRDDNDVGDELHKTFIKMLRTMRAEQRKNLREKIESGKRAH